MAMINSSTLRKTPRQGRRGRENGIGDSPVLIWSSRHSTKALSREGFRLFGKIVLADDLVAADTALAKMSSRFSTMLLPAESDKDGAPSITVSALSRDT